MSAMLAIEAHGLDVPVLDGYRHPWCPTGKLAWTSKPAAKVALRQIQSLRGGGRHAVRAYHCDRCGAFHTTSSGRRMQ